MPFVHFARKSNVPVYILWTNQQPIISRRKKSQKQKVRALYRESLKDSAEQQDVRLIETDDIEVEVIFASREKPDQRPDMDNVTRLTLNLLQGIAYRNDRQVRHHAGTFIDLTQTQQLVLPGEHDEIVRRFVIALMQKHAVVVLIYSDSHLQKLGGEEEVLSRRRKEYQAFVDKAITASV